MRGIRRVLTGAAVAAALIIPATASAAPTVAATGAPGTPQDCQAGCIWTLKLACSAADPLSVQTTVRCWTNSWNKFTLTQDLPASALHATQYSSGLGGYTLCVEGFARYRDGSTASTVKCSSGDDLGVTVVAG